MKPAEEEKALYEAIARQYVAFISKPAEDPAGDPGLMPLTDALRRICPEAAADESKLKGFILFAAGADAGAAIASGLYERAAGQAPRL